jgi:hypothetical protein
MSDNRHSARQSQVLYFLISAVFYGALLSYSFFPTVYLSVLGQHAWIIHLMSLTLWAIISLLGFSATIVQQGVGKHNRWLFYLNAIFASVPLYYLWLTFQHISSF